MTGELMQLLQLEEKMRLINSEIQGFEDGKINKEVYELSRKGYYDFWKFRDLMNRVDEAKRVLYDMDEKELYNEFRDTIHPLIDWGHEIENWKDVACRREGAFMKCEEVPAKPFYELQTQVRDSGIKCGFIAPEESKISILKAVDSFTNCIHTFAMETSKLVNEKSELEEETYGICRVLDVPHDPETRKSLFEACKTFAEYVSYNQESYYSDDRGKQEGVILGNKIQFRVGGAASHYAEVNLDTMEFRYYDHNTARASALKNALEGGVNLSCEGYVDFVCKLNDQEDAITIAKLLAFLPSLDIWMDDILEEKAQDSWSDCMRECRDDPYGWGVNVEECEEKCEEECEESEDVEECIEECMDPCIDEECDYSCENYVAEVKGDIYSELSSCLYGALYDVVKGYSDSYDDVIEALRDC